MGNGDMVKTLTDFWRPGLEFPGGRLEDKY